MRKRPDYDYNKTVYICGHNVGIETKQNQFINTSIAVSLFWTMLVQTSYNASVIDP